MFLDRLAGRLLFPSDEPVGNVDVGVQVFGGRVLLHGRGRVYFARGTIRARGFYQITANGKRLRKLVLVLRTNNQTL